MEKNEKNIHNNLAIGQCGFAAGIRHNHFESLNYVYILNTGSRVPTLLLAAGLMNGHIVLG